MTLVFPTGVFAQDPSTEVGIAAPGQNVIEIIGQIDQSLFTLTTYGYVTHIAGIPDELLFAEGTSPLMRDASTARFTFYGAGQANGRAIHNNIFASSVDSTLDFYYNETPIGANFDEPATFATGTLVTTMSARLYSVLNVQEPDIGVLMVSSDASQETVEPFSIGDETYTLGHIGLLYHFTLFGQGFRSSTDPLAAQYFFGGYAVFIGENETME
jgi:hypothetical protein